MGTLTHVRFLLLSTFLLISFSSADRRQIETGSAFGGVKLIASDSFNSTFVLASSSESFVLRSFNTTPGNVLRTYLHIKSANSSRDKLFRLVGSSEMRAYVGNGFRHVHKAGAVDYYGKTGCDCVTDGGVVVNTPVTLSRHSGPLNPNFLSNSGTIVEPYFQFSANVSRCTVEVQMEYKVFDTNVANNSKTSIPAFNNADILTYDPNGLRYNLTLIFKSTKPGITISDRLLNLTYHSVINQRRDFFDMASLNVSKWNITLFGLQGRTVIELKNKHVVSQDICLTLLESINPNRPVPDDGDCGGGGGGDGGDGDGDGDGSDGGDGDGDGGGDGNGDGSGDGDGGGDGSDGGDGDSDGDGDGGGDGNGDGGDDNNGDGSGDGDGDDDRLETGHIILIAIGGAFFVAFVASLVVGIAVGIRRHRRGSYTILGTD